MRSLIVAAVAAVSGVTPASAQDSFTGVHAGGAVTAVDHHFVLEETEYPSGSTRQFNVTKWGIGGQGFAGYDLAVTRHIMLGAEGAFDFGGRTAIERNPFYIFGIKPRHGYSITARAGYVVTPRLMLYAGGGYGEHAYRVVDSEPNLIGGSQDLDHNRSFVLRGGAEIAVRHHVAIRAEFEHLDGTRNQFILGVPIRF